MPRKKKILRGRQGETKVKIKQINTFNKAEVLSSLVLQNNRPGFWSRALNAVGEFKLSLGLIFKLLFVSKIGVVLMFLLIAVPMTAFEAHVVNVTATIERKPCEEFEIRSMGYWKNHSENRIFPQTVGDTTVTNDAEADAVFDLPNDVMANKLKKQLLALKFDIAYFGSGAAILGGGDNTTLSELAADADAALLADPQVNDTLTFYHNLIEEIVTSEIISTCDLFFEGEEFQSFGASVSDAVLSDGGGSETEDSEELIEDGLEATVEEGESDGNVDNSETNTEEPAAIQPEEQLPAEPDQVNEPDVTTETTSEPQLEPEPEPTSEPEPEPTPEPMIETQSEPAPTSEPEPTPAPQETSPSPADPTPTE